MTANQQFFDAQVRRAISVARYTSGEARRVVALLDQADKELMALLLARLTPGDFTSQRYKALLKDIRALRAELWKVARGTNLTEMTQLTQLEHSWANSAFTLAIPVEISFAVVSAETLQSLLTTTPFGGANAARTLQAWWARLEAVDAQRVQEAIQSGLILGEGIPEMAARVQLVLPLTRRNAEAVVRTAANFAASLAHDAFFQANADIIEALRWMAMLDGRTTPICRARDGKLAPVVPGQTVPPPRLQPPQARPPAHVKCRSRMIAILSVLGIAAELPDRAFVRDTRTAKRRELDFRKQARATGRPIQELKREWSELNIGRVPGVTNYDEWLRTQSRAFQDELLGAKRAALFRGGMKLDQFVTYDGKELTLKQLGGV